MKDFQIYSKDNTKKGLITTRFFAYINWGLWGAALIFFGQNTWASLYENEIRAAIIYALFALLLLMGGGIVSMSRKFKDIF